MSVFGNQKGYPLYSFKLINRDGDVRYNTIFTSDDPNNPASHICTVDYHGHPHSLNTCHLAENHCWQANLIISQPEPHNRPSRRVRHYQSLQLSESTSGYHYVPFNDIVYVYTARGDWGNSIPSMLPARLRRSIPLNMTP